ncbi:MAG TPA: 4-alpha-glucanotransferase [Pseudonocardiaceae bacterium]|nr:4-alpha-glucanotransferase [Pseudonocardiaceae bacterium]
MAVGRTLRPPAFHDRRDAGRRLAELAGQRDWVDPVVFGIARGGVPVAAEVARALHAPLAVAVARKIGAPGHRELGVGAVTADGPPVFDQAALSALRLRESDLHRAVQRERTEARRRAAEYRSGSYPGPIEDHDVLLVDDGLATGVTARAALRELRDRRPRRLVLAAPVCSEEAARMLAGGADETDGADDVLCLAAVLDFGSVGQWYRDFTQTSDAEVRAAIAEARRRWHRDHMHSVDRAVDPELAELAAAHGVAVSYEDAQRRLAHVDPDVVIAVLRQLGVAAGSPAEVRRELAVARAKGAELPPTIVLREGHGRALPDGVAGELRREDGAVLMVRGELPADLPLGWHELATGDRRVTVIVVPRRLPEPPRTWGWMVQLYALRSDGSWGMGDLADLRELARWSSGGGVGRAAGAVLVNPLHGPTPVLPVEASPYAPSSRRFANPLYLRIEDTAGYRRCPEDIRRKVDALRPPNGDRIDYDGVWSAKRAALELLRQHDSTPVGIPDDPSLRDFATFCALAETHGPSWRAWPARLRSPGSPEVARERDRLADRVDFHTWLQRLCDQQFDAVREAAKTMPIGVVHDLAVGVDPDGADAWALQDVLAVDCTVGAPPDAFSQQGQDWQLPPWHPRKLAEAGYQPYRDVVRAALRHGGGLRVDHVAGLWRLWWVPQGEPPSRGAYVYYDAEAMLGVLALEAFRAGAVVVGEDLGTIPPEVGAGLRERRVLGSAVLWFQHPERGPDDDVASDDGPAELLPPADWPRNVAASISTHDLPTAAGFLRGEHVRVRAELGLLAGPPEQERTRAAAEQARLLELLRAEGLVSGEPSEDEVIVAMHQLLARTPCLLRLVSPYDVLGEPRQPNLPGTIDQYPNWRLPLPLSLEDFQRDPRVARIAELFGKR